jgi:hypothetical protein
VAGLPPFSPAAFTVSWSGSDGAGGSGLASYDVFVSDNGGPFTAWLTGTTQTSATYTGQDGHAYAFYSVATDNIGNREATPTSAQASTRVDAVPPSSIVSPLPSLINTKSFTVSWSGQDNAGGSGIASYDVFVSDDGGPFTAWLTGTAQTSAVFPGQDGHAYAFYSVATDQAGNRQPTPAAAQASTAVDATPPSSRVGRLPPYSPATFTVTWSGSDGANGSGIAGFDIFVSDDGGPFTAWLTGTTQTSATFTGAGGHGYAFYSVASDNAGNRQPTPAGSQAGTAVDSTPPSSSVASLPPFSPAAFTVSWSGQDNAGGSGIAGLDIFVSDNGGPFTAWQTGTTQTSAVFAGQDGHAYAFYSVATDWAGNREGTPATPEASTEVDAVPPSSSVSPLPGFSNAASFTVSWSGQDSAGGSGVASYDVFVSDDRGPFTAWLTGSTQTSAVFAGQDGHAYAFYSVATDNVGNRQPAPAAAQAGTAVDATPPRSSVSPLPSVSNAATFTVSWSGSDNAGGSGIASYDVFVSDDGGPFTAWLIGTTRTSAPFTGQGGHAYAFYSLATDRAGNHQPTPATAQASTRVDVIAPTSSVNALPAVVNTPVFSVSWSGGDGAGGSGIASYDVFVSDNGGPFTAWLTGSTQTSAAFPGQDGHAYAFYSVATDNAGNRQPTPAAAQASTAVEAAPPSSSVASLPPFSPAAFAVSWSGQGTGSGSAIASYDVFVSNDRGPFTAWLTGTTQTSAVFTGQDDHAYAFYSVATDNVGNRESAPTAAEASTRVDAVPPISSVSPLPAIINAATFTVSWSGQDNAGGSGIASYVIFVSVDGGAFVPWQTGTTETSATYGGSFGHSYAFSSVATDQVGNRQATPTTAQATTTLAEPSPLPTAGGDITAGLVGMKVGKKKRLMVEVFFTDTGAEEGQFRSPFQHPRFKKIQVRVGASNGDGLPDLVIVTARKGKETVAAVFPG